MVFNSSLILLLIVAVTDCGCGDFAEGFDEQFRLQFIERSPPKAKGHPFQTANC